MNSNLKMSVVAGNQVNNIPSISSTKSFQDTIKDLLDDCQNAFSRENKMKIALQIYKFINDEIGNLIQKKWIRFICTVFYKIIELETDYYSGSYNEIDKNLVKIFLDELYKAKICIMNIIKNFNETHYDNTDCFYIDSKTKEIVLKTVEIVSKTKEVIASLESQRPRRYIQRVDYTGMDSIEPESELDGITNIWEDLTIKEDPDYEFEEDHDDEEEPLWVRAHPDLDAVWLLNRPKLSEEILNKYREYYQQVFGSRPKRNVPRVNYAGMA